MYVKSTWNSKPNLQKSRTTLAVQNPDDIMGNLDSGKEEYIIVTRYLTQNITKSKDSCVVINVLVR